MPVAHRANANAKAKAKVPLRLPLLGTTAGASSASLPALHALPASTTPTGVAGTAADWEEADDGTGLGNTYYYNRCQPNTNDSPPPSPVQISQYERTRSVRVR